VALFYISLELIMVDMPERLVNEQLELLTQSNDDLSQFAYLAAHELQEPLRAITGFLNLLDKRHSIELSDEAREFLGEAVSAAERMNTLIRALLRLSEVESQDVVFDLIDVNECLDDALQNLRCDIEAKRAIVRRDKLPEVPGEKTLLTLVFQNLISNSLKFCTSLPVVEVSVTEDQDNWIFNVRDNGIGFDMQYGDRLFHRFQRLHSKSQYPGNGLGLALCKRIIDRHLGRIWAKSEPGNGSTFSFTLHKQFGGNNESETV
jgi:light-regulated signal transduction histidine kinase (bacteriophytochrome)